MVIVYSIFTFIIGLLVGAQYGANYMIKRIEELDKMVDEENQMKE